MSGRLFIGVDMASAGSGSADCVSVVGMSRGEGGLVVVEGEAMLRAGDESSWGSVLEREFGAEASRRILEGIGDGLRGRRLDLIMT